MKKIIVVIVICCFQLPIIVTGQNTQILQILKQAQSSNALRQKYIIVDASDTNQLCIKYNNQISFIEPFQTVNLGCSLLRNDQSQLCWAIIECSESLVSEESIIYESPFFLYDNNYDTIGVSHLLYVKIRSLSDTVLLEHLAREKNVEIVGVNRYMPLWYTLSCNKYSDGNALEMASFIRTSGLFDYCEPDLLTRGKLNNPNDPYFPSQWNLSNTGQNGGTPNMDIKIINAHKITEGNNAITVAVLDHGFELNHPDLGSINPFSYDTEFDTSPSKVYGNHGTACAGIIGAALNNNIGIVGIAPDSPLMSISNMLLGLEPDENQKLANGINFAWKNGAAVISNSWHFLFDSCALISNAIDSAVTFGREGKGCIVVFAAGNNNDTVNYPACLGNVIAVGAIDRCGVRSGRIDVVPESCEPWNSTADPGSAFGEKLDVVAPGTHIYTTDRQGNEGYNELKGTAGDYYEFFGGTSAACPHVAGVAALMLSINPNLTSQEVRDIVEQTARKIRKDLYSYVDTLGHPNGEWNMYMGYGLIDAHRAVLKAAYHKIYGDSLLTLCDTNVHPYTVHSTHNADIDSVSFFWTCSDNLQIVVGQNTDSVWVRPSNGGTGHLSCYIIHDSDTVISTLDIPIVSNYTVYDNIFVNNGIGFPDTFILSRNIEIDSMTVLTWQDKSILCTPDSRIIVHPGGKLIVNGGTLTNSCTGEMWQGIYVEGHSNLHQTEANQGKVVLRNGAAIENALCGIRTGAPGDTSTTSTGGIITAEDATFRNCNMAVYMRPYTDYTATGLLKPNASSFYRCTFSVDNAYYGLPGSEVMARLWGVAGVRFGGCTFSLATTPMNTGRSYGIYSEDAGFTVDTYCSQEIMNSDCSCPSQYATLSSFSGFYKAVNINTSGSPFAVTIDEVSFSNNQTGVFVSGNNHTTVTRCQFDLSTAPETAYPAIGLELTACTGFLVEGNAFSRSSSTFPTYGVKAAGLGISNNSLYRNTFSGLTYGIHSSGNNGGSFSGLRFSCNTFSQNTHDIYVTSGQVAETQGNSAAGADNSFSSGATGNFEVLNPKSQLDYYYSTVGSHSPTAHTTNVLLHSNASANGCASTLCTGGGVIKGLTEYRELSNSINGASADNYDADGKADRIAVLQEMSDIASANIRGIEGGDTIDVDILKDWFSTVNETWSKYSLAETEYFSDENNTPTLLGIPALLTTTEERDEYDNYMAFNALKESLSGSIPGHANWPMATEGQITELQRIADAGTGRSSVMARGVLCFFFNICYDDGMQMAETRRAAAKDGGGYMPVLTDDTVTFSIAFQITTFSNEYDPYFLGGESDFFYSSPSDTVCFNNQKYRDFSLYDYYYLREDTLTGQLFRYFPQLDTEVMTCDMSLQEGDTFYLPHCLDDDFYYIELSQEYWIVDSVTYSNGRKVIWFPYVTASYRSFFAHKSNGYQPCFIEGIGPAYGPFGMLPISMEPYLGILLCVHHNDSLIYMTDSLLGCEQHAVLVSDYPDLSMKLYPNPATNTLHVEFEGTDNPQGTITVTDLTGVVVLTRECNSPVTQLDVSNLSPGLYVVSFRNEKGVIVRKFVKM